MKSPWKFLAELALRRRTLEVEDKLVGDDTNGEANKTETESAPTQHPGRPETTPSFTKVERDPTIVAATAVAPDARLAANRSSSVPQNEAQEAARGGMNETRDGPPDAPTFVAKDDARVHSERTLRRRRAKRAEKSASLEIVPRTGPVTREPNGKSPFAGDPLLDDASILDAEISQLRKRLAQKLYLQNIQLRKML